MYIAKKKFYSAPWRIYSGIWGMLHMVSEHMLQTLGLIWAQSEGTNIS